MRRGRRETDGFYHCRVIGREGSGERMTATQYENGLKWIQKLEEEPPKVCGTFFQKKFMRPMRCCAIGWALLLEQDFTGEENG